ncbi:hypothetical protein [Mycolicibacterium smegmatis]|uniref:Uncharacterized protein n=1 Tax=Mycolicibacterium smegmatis (strain MKD8) TaxID=1214915 RepID=A0A2U9PVN6_MYCSE|nr:hypothetical protein [Mycolicibacterium smegmatis]AWT55804.1 hypothetical protein D806_048530 [Mycolicibacterium smegmatis MKD8]
MIDREFVSDWEPRWRAGPPADGADHAGDDRARDATAAALYAVRRREPALSMVLDAWAEHDPFSALPGACAAVIVDHLVFDDAAAMRFTAAAEQVIAEWRAGRDPDTRGTATQALWRLAGAVWVCTDVGSAHDTQRELFWILLEDRLLRLAEVP